MRQQNIVLTVGVTGKSKLEQNTHNTNFVKAGLETACEETSWLELLLPFV